MVVGRSQSWVCSSRRWVYLKLSVNLVPDIGCMVQSQTANNTAWENVVTAIQTCQVASAKQTHKREVRLTLKNGYLLSAIEPHMDDIMDVVASVNQKCGDFPFFTE